MCVGLYAVFLAIQTTRHRSYFVDLADEPNDDGRAAARTRLPPNQAPSGVMSAISSRISCS